MEHLTKKHNKNRIPYSPDNIIQIITSEFANDLGKNAIQKVCLLLDNIGVRYDIITKYQSVIITPTDDDSYTYIELSGVGKKIDVIIDTYYIEFTQLRISKDLQESITVEISKMLRGYQSS
jgi:hypothetical protein